MRLKLKKLVELGLFAMLATGTRAVSGLAYGILVIRWLPQNEYAILFLFDSIRIIITNFCDASIGQAYIKYASEKESNDISYIATSIIIIKAFLIIIISAPIMIFSGYISNFFNIAGLENLLILLPYLLILICMQTFSTQLLIAVQKIKNVFIINIFYLSFLVFILLIIKNLYGIKDAKQVVYILGATYFFTFLFSLLFIKHYKILGKAPLNVLKKLLRFSRYSFLNNLGSSLTIRNGAFFLAYFLNPLSVAAYGCAMLFSNIYNLFGQVSNMVVFPQTSKIYCSSNENKNESIKSLYSKSVSIILIISIGISFLLIIFTKPILNILFDGKYLDTVQIVRIIALTGIIFPFFRVGSSIFNGIGRPDVNVKYTWIALCINVLMNIILIPIYGTLGAIISFSLSMMLLSIIYLNKLIKKYKVNLNEITMYPIQQTYQLIANIRRNYSIK